VAINLSHGNSLLPDLQKSGARLRGGDYAGIKNAEPAMAAGSTM